MRAWCEGEGEVWDDAPLDFLEEECERGRGRRILQILYSRKGEEKQPTCRITWLLRSSCCVPNTVYNLSFCPLTRGVSISMVPENI